MATSSIFEYMIDVARIAKEEGWILNNLGSDYPLHFL
jgi:hypothetical protein